MKIYLAGGVGLMNVIGREREVMLKLSNKEWRRLFSFHYPEYISRSNILNLAKEFNHENIPSNLDK